jgi:hypothetical protein
LLSMVGSSISVSSRGTDWKVNISMGNLKIIYCDER